MSVGTATLRPEHRASAVAVARSIAARSLLLIPRIPSTFVPSLVMPVFLTIAFSGQFAGVVALPGFPAAKMIDWILPMTILQGSAFAGVTTGLGVARDLENGFYDRLLLSPAPRSGLLMGPLIASVLRATLPLLLLPFLFFLGGASLPGGMPGVATLLVACWGTAFVGGAWALGVALRLKTTRGAPLMQTAVFVTIYLSTAQMPIELLTGWLHDIARVNPMTNVLALAREGFLGDVTWSGSWPGLISLAAMGLVLLAFAGRGLARVAP